jgi:uncharacterized SAM-binding protein YcdF (DUF218 family)
MGPDVRHASPLKRLFVPSALVLGALVLLSLYPLSRLGAWLVVQDPLAKADAIIVLGGTMYERQLEAADPYNAGYGPRIYLIREQPDWGERELVKRGITLTGVVDLQVEALVKTGVPREAIEILQPATSTAVEADYAYALVTSQRMSRVIVVTSKQHTRRARLVMTRRLEGTGVQVIMRATRYDQSDVARWWRHRATLQFTAFESPRWFLYWIGVAD